MKKITKKGQAIDSFGMIATGVATLCIGLIVAFLVMNNTESQGIEQISPTTTTNGQFTFSNGTATTIGLCVDDLSCTALMNASSGTEISSGNYTCADTQITATIVNFANPAATLFLNYTCDERDLSYNATGTLRAATATIPGWTPLIILVLIGATILVLVRKGF